MSKIAERYTSAITSSNLSSDERTTYSDTDVLGAMGLAGRLNPLGTALARLLAGGKSVGALDALADMAWDRARKDGSGVSREYAMLMAKEVLAWYGHGNCQYCSGRGKRVIADTWVLGDDCEHCKGTGRIDLLECIPQKRHGLARWLTSQIDISIATVGGEAMRKLVERSDAG